MIESEYKNDLKLNYEDICYDIDSVCNNTNIPKNLFYKKLAVKIKNVRPSQKKQNLLGGLCRNICKISR